MKLAWRTLATCFGIGFIPVAPGTVASLAVVLLYKFFLQRLAWPFYLLLFFILCLGGVMASTAYSLELQQKDPRRVVIDEACGQLILFPFAPPTWPVLALSFFLFRLFDIVKPFPVRRVEKLPRGWGIMADDLVAGLMGKVLLSVYLWLT